MAVTGNLYPFIQEQARRGTPPLSFLQESFTDLEAWRDSTREYLRSLLMFSPEIVPLDPELVDHTERDDLVQEKWYFSSVPGERIPVMLIQPRSLQGPAPAILALHDHGGMYYFGKKQLVEEANEPQLLRQFRQDRFEGVAIADALARQGYVVAVIDSFYFGERRAVVAPPPEMQNDFLLAGEGSDAWIELLNRVSAVYEPIVAKSLFWAGITWPGVLAWDDMRTVDFLRARPEVDPTRLGCVGLGMGAFRSALLGALDPRITAACVVGWMSTLVEMLEEHVARHSWASFVPGLTRVLGWPDVAGLHAPTPLLVMQGSQDPYFPLNGFQQAAERLRGIYSKAGTPGTLDIGLFDAGHQFTLNMQEHAWAFFDAAFGITREVDPAE